MTPLGVLIVDDEPPARRRLRALLALHPDVELVAECSTGRDAVAAIRRLRPDLVFLDVQMPRMDGFAVIEEVGVENMPAVIFVTAHDEHALRAFEVNALDYVLKPFDEERFAASLRRARRHIERGARGDSEFRDRVRGAIADLQARTAYRTRFAVKSTERIYFVATDAIDFIEARGKYVRLHAADGEHVLRAPIGQVESELDPERFLRIHRSTIVNVERIKEIQPLFHGEYAVILRDGTELTLSRSQRAALRKLLGGSGG